MLLAVLILILRSSAAQAIAELPGDFLLTDFDNTDFV